MQGANAPVNDDVGSTSNNKRIMFLRAGNMYTTVDLSGMQYKLISAIGKAFFAGDWSATDKARNEL